MLKLSLESLESISHSYSLFYLLLISWVIRGRILDANACNVRKEYLYIRRSLLSWLSLFSMGGGTLGITDLHTKYKYKFCQEHLANSVIKQ